MMTSKTPIVMVLISLFLVGCLKKPVQMETILDSPEHHVASGFLLIKKDMLNDAEREFVSALQDDPKYSPALRGRGLVCALRKEFKPAFEFMTDAGLYAEQKQEKALAHVGFIRLYTMRGGEGWLMEAEKNFYLAISLVKNLPDAYYYLGIAYKSNKKYAEAASSFKKVLEINKTFVMEAEEKLQNLQAL